MKSIDLTPAELSYIANLIISNIEEGTYWGRRDQHWGRVRKLLEKLDPAIKVVYDKKITENLTVEG